MRSLDEAGRAVLIIALLCFTFLFGRPLYWGILAHMEPDDDGGDFDDDLDLTAPKLPHGVVARPKSPGAAHEAASSTTETQKPDPGGVPSTAGEKPQAATPPTFQTETREQASPELEARSETQKVIPPESLAKGVRAIVHEGKPLLETQKLKMWEPPGPDEAFPGKDAFALRREMVEFRASSDKYILVTFANFAFMDFVINWVKHLTEQNSSNILVGAMDERILEGLWRVGVPVFDMESRMQAEDAGWGSPVFHAMGREKVTLVNVFLALGYNLVICDTDAVFLRDPLPYMRRYPDVDVLMSSDHLARTVDNDDLEDFAISHGAYNIGILVFRPTEAARRFAKAWAELLAGDEKIWDQNGFNDLMRKKIGPPVLKGSSEHLFYAFDGTLKAGILPVSVFCSGHTYFIQRLYSVVNIPAYAIHTTFQFCGTPGKRHRLRESLHFRDPPPYYDPPGGVLSLSSPIPAPLLHGGNHTLETHFALMNYQIRQLRVMMALAVLLNRTLVFPEIWARYDSQYFPHAGIVEHTDTAQPLIVPLDHLFQVDKMLPGALDEGDMGPPFHFREYSFLDNPAVKPQIKASKVSVILCRDESDKGEGGEGGEEDRSLPPFSSRKKGRVSAETENLLPCTTRLSSPNQVLLKQGSSTSQIVEALRPFRSFKWMDFTSHVEHLIGSWDDKKFQRKFYRRLKHSVGTWCCLYASPGHIYYDVFADSKPGWRPRPPANPSEDHPPIDE